MAEHQHLPMGSFSITSAHEGGFFVMTQPIGYQDTPRHVVFAGDLDECLAFVRGKLEPEPPSLAVEIVDGRRIDGDEVRALFGMLRAEIRAAAGRKSKARA